MAKTDFLTADMTRRRVHREERRLLFLPHPLLHRV